VHDAEREERKAMERESTTRRERRKENNSYPCAHPLSPVLIPVHDVEPVHMKPGPHMHREGLER
jgi:hypothetical protein